MNGKQTKREPEPGRERNVQRAKIRIRESEKRTKREDAARVGSCFLFLFSLLSIPKGEGKQTVYLENSAEGVGQVVAGKEKAREVCQRVNSK